MEKNIVYHGSNVEVSVPRILQNGFYKDFDFPCQTGKDTPQSGRRVHPNYAFLWLSIIIEPAAVGESGDISSTLIAHRASRPALICSPAFWQCIP